MFVTTVVQITQVVRKAEQEPELLDAQVGSGEGIPPASAVGRLDQPFQNVQGRSLDSVAEQKLLTAGETLHGRYQPDEKTKVRFQRRAGFARVVGADAGWLGRFIGQGLSPVSSTEKNTRGPAPWTPEVKS